jgi:hypothetical protein
MRNVLGLLVILVAEALDRTPVAVPDIDEYDSPYAGLHIQARTQQ